MPFLDNIEKISGVTKAALFILVVISSGVGAYYKIFDNADAILLIKSQEIRDKAELQKIIKDAQLDLEKELSLQSSRANKRYSRAMKIADDHEKRIRDIEKMLNYIKGKEGY